MCQYQSLKGQWDPLVLGQEEPKLGLWEPLLGQWQPLLGLWDCWSLYWVISK